MEGCRNILESVSAVYEGCVNPVGILHTVHDRTVKDAFIGLTSCIREFSSRADEPLAESASRMLNNLRWDLLSECRPFTELVRDRIHEIDTCLETARSLGAPSTRVEVLKEKFLELSSLKENPLTSAIKSILSDTQWEIDLRRLRVVPYGKYKSVATRRKEMALVALSGTALDSSHFLTLKECRDLVEPFGQVILIGSPGAFGNAVVTAPLASLTHFLFYNFYSVGSTGNEWQSSFSILKKGLPEPHRMNFQRIYHGSDEPGTPAIEDRVEVSRKVLTDDSLTEQDVYTTLHLGDQVNRAKRLGEKDESEEDCTCILLEGDFWAAVPGRARVVRRDDSVGWIVDAVDPIDVEPGDFLLLLAREPSSLASETSSELAETHGVGLELWKSVQETVKDVVDKLGWANVSVDLQRMGVDSPQKYWFDHGRLGPHDNNAFLTLCSSVGLSIDESRKALQAVKAWTASRIQAGRIISDRFAERSIKILSALDESGDPVENHPGPIVELDLDGDEFGKYVLCRVVGIMGEDRIPSSRCRRILTPGGFVWHG